MNKTLFINLLSMGLALFAVFGTLLGGLVLAFDKTLWPIDGYVLYFGNITHVLVIPVSALAFVKSCKTNPKPQTAWLIMQGAIFIVAVVSVILTHQGMFNYGWWPS
jgi:hypothetical protein